MKLDITAAIAVGIGATLLIDLWNLFLRSAFNVRSLDFCLLGRWVCYIPEGTLWHASIIAAPRKSFECATGWFAHYTIGVVLALVFITFASSDWLVHPSLLPALLYGAATVILPLFILQPSLGFGVASSRMPHPMKARLKSLVTHSVFGVGLYLSALCLGYAQFLFHQSPR